MIFLLNKAGVEEEARFVSEEILKCIESLNVKRK
jgi:hypothetical protein